MYLRVSHKLDPGPQVIREGNLATTVMGPNGRAILQAPTNFGARNKEPSRDTNGNNMRAPNNTRPAQSSYASAAANVPATTIPGFNMASQRASHTQNDRGANHPSNNSKQPAVVRDDHYKLCPDTRNVQRVERFKTVPTKSDKQKSRENKRHEKDLAQLMKELVYFGVPTRAQNGAIMTKDQDKTRVAKFLRELKRGGYTTKNGDVVSTVRFQLEEEDVGPANGYPEGAVSHEPNNNAATAMEEMMNKMQEIQERYDRLKANQEAAKTARETKEKSDFELQDPFG